MLLTLPRHDAEVTLDATLIGARERTHPPSPAPVALGPNTPPYALLTLIVESHNRITRRGETVTLGPGDAMLLLPGEEFRARLASERGARVVNVLFEARCESAPGWADLFPGVVRAAQDTTELRRAMEACARALAHGRAPLARLEFATALLALARLRLAQQESALSPPVRRALEHIRRHCDRPMGRDEIAAAAGVSPSHLSHLMRRQSGATLNEQIGRARVAKATALIHDTALNFSEIALALEMDLPRLSRLFKRVTGATPSDYARLARSGAA